MAWNFILSAKAAPSTGTGTGISVGIGIGMELIQALLIVGKVCYTSTNSVVHVLYLLLKWISIHQLIKLRI